MFKRGSGTFRSAVSLPVSLAVALGVGLAAGSVDVAPSAAAAAPAVGADRSGITPEQLKAALLAAADLPAGYKAEREPVIVDGGRVPVNGLGISPAETGCDLTIGPAQPTAATRPPATEPPPTEPPATEPPATEPPPTEPPATEPPPTKPPATESLTRPSAARELAWARTAATDLARAKTAVTDLAWELARAKAATDPGHPAYVASVSFSKSEAGPVLAEMLMTGAPKANRGFVAAFAEQARRCPRISLGFSGVDERIVMTQAPLSMPSVGHASAAIAYSVTLPGEAPAHGTMVAFAKGRVAGTVTAVGAEKEFFAIVRAAARKAGGAAQGS
ncbi:hypothetical protein [Paractinoplanes rishiriensis]|uniref:Uncharacterized protein n=1 Tax=Paractinoplanes rishiriensis TaxID=1050105 RepID=A0A919MSR3_9ACTN|nr:hypothetical protein [Actinoplanes rishiriensis]GIE93474.1 hypothetical protein Ari01nite_09390 [Actinoplanes rishiriensis]